ncbi:hypothetical protein [Neptuniibacter sp. QD37_11]|uniref:hypothetical protein n=1 Tax=Neptuniibacter sp. QD37_11 TaxID=3398209 RepID=UPI0039F60D40
MTTSLNQAKLAMLTSRLATALRNDSANTLNDVQIDQTPNSEYANALQAHHCAFDSLHNALNIHNGTMDLDWISNVHSDSQFGPVSMAELIEAINTLEVVKIDHSPLADNPAAEDEWSEFSPSVKYAIKEFENFCKSDHCQEDPDNKIDSSNSQDWFSLSLGFFSAKGLPSDEAWAAACFVRYQCHYWV